MKRFAQLPIALSFFVVACVGAASPSDDPASKAPPRASTEPPSESPASMPGIAPASSIDSPALRDPAPTSSSRPAASSIVRVPCKDGEADGTCSERAQREALRGAPKGARVLGVVMGSDVTAYRAALEIDGVVERFDAASTDEVAEQAKALAAAGHRVVVRAIDAAPGATRQRSAKVLLTTSG